MIAVGGLGILEIQYYRYPECKEITFSLFKFYFDGMRLMSESRTGYLLRNIGILTVSNFASKILVFLLIPLYTRALSTSEYGSYDIVYSAIQLLFPIFTMNISDAVMRFSMDKDKDKKYVALIGVKIVFKGLIPIVVLLIGCWRFEWIPSIKGYEILILAYFCTYFWNQFLIQLAKGMEQIFDMGISGVISTIALVTGNVFFLLIIQNGLTGFYCANIFAQMLSTVYLAVRLKIWRLPLLEKSRYDLEKQMLLYCLPLIITVLGWWINNTADKYTVYIMCGAAANGLLSVAYKIPSMINVVQNIILQAWQISAIREYGTRDSSVFYGQMFALLNASMALVCAGLVLFTKPIARIMYAKDFYYAWVYVPFLLLASLLTSSSAFLGSILSAKKDSKSMAMSAVYGGLINVVMNIVLVYYLGIQGATIATVISSLVIYIIRKKAVGQEIAVPNYKLIIITWILLILQSSFEVYTSLWWVECLLVLIIIMVNKNMYQMAIKTIIMKLNKEET